MCAAPSLNCVARSEQREKPPAAGYDLNARIQAQVAARRRKDAPGEVSVAALLAAQLADPPVSSASVNGHARAAVATGRHGQPSARRSSASAKPARGRHGQEPQAPRGANRLARLVFLLVLTVVAVFGLRSYAIASYYIPSASMETTLHGCPNCEPDMVLVDKLSYRVSAISRTDVVVFNRPPLAPPEDKQLIKRVIGLPGDVVSGHDGHVYIGGRQLVEPYVNPACHGTADFAAVTVPAGRYFMMGDNRCDSFDSRMFGTIPRSSVVGRAFAVIWPVKHLRWL
jgi:signal peptidase I